MSHILVIEDEKILRELIAGELEKKGHKVITAANGQLGWDLIVSEKPELILLDLLMPVMSGYEVLEALRADETLAKTPCIVISNSGQIEDLNRAYELGANDVLIKASFNPDEVVGKVEKLLASHVSQ